MIFNIFLAESDSHLMMHSGDTRGKGGRVQYSATEELGSDAMGGYSLEDYIYSLEARGGGAANTANTHTGPYYSDFGSVNFEEIIKYVVELKVESFDDNGFPYFRHRCVWPVTTEGERSHPGSGAGQGPAGEK